MVEGKAEMCSGMFRVSVLSGAESLCGVVQREARRREPGDKWGAEQAGSSSRPSDAEL